MSQSDSRSCRKVAKLAKTPQLIELREAELHIERERRRKTDGSELHELRPTGHAPRGALRASAPEQHLMEIKPLRMR
jgi:hypothetical protein